MASALKSARRQLSPRMQGDKARSSYLALFRSYPIRPLRSEKELDEALSVAQKLFCRKEPLNREEQDYFDILSNEIARYESNAYPMPVVSEAGLLRHLLDARAATLSEAAHQTGISLSTLSAVLHGKRKLNLVHVRKLAKYFGVEPSVFIDSIQ